VGKNPGQRTVSYLSGTNTVKDLVASIRTWITDWNDDPHPQPFVWHNSADEILDGLAAYSQRIKMAQVTRCGMAHGGATCADKA
jgi:hypothetical protein